MISVSYILLCGQFFLLLSVIFLQCLEGIHSQNSSTAEPPASASPGQGATGLPFSEQPPSPGVEKYDIPAESDNETERFEYRPPSPVVLCSYLPEEFIFCQDPVDHAGNYTALQELGHGCAGWGGQTQKEIIPPRRRPLHQIHRTLFHHHTAVLLLPGLLRCRPLLPGSHRHRRREAAHSGGFGDLVVRGSDPAHHWRPDAQRLQQLVHVLLRPTAERKPGLDSSTSSSSAARGASSPFFFIFSCCLSCLPAKLIKITATSKLEHRATDGER
ncbi:TM2 domain-containing protein 2 [Solea senegalensis]|uniref:TM2 domain-containing protein 2 n=1 Tax=Solea senegalensis TaxID=28829 RepID=A0AAV6QDB2_SOLSE|nr:TM2 domain-containing protein 2 [Solea senegalensis]